MGGAFVVVLGLAVLRIHHLVRWVEEGEGQGGAQGIAADLALGAAEILHAPVVDVVGVHVETLVALLQGGKIHHLLEEGHRRAETQAVGIEVGGAGHGEHQLDQVGLQPRRLVAAQLLLHGLDQGIGLQQGPVGLGDGAGFLEYLEIDRIALVEGVGDAHVHGAAQGLQGIAALGCQVEQADEGAGPGGGNHVEFDAGLLEGHQGAGHEGGVGGAAPDDQCSLCHCVVLRNWVFRQRRPGVVRRPVAGTDPSLHRPVP